MLQLLSLIPALPMAGFLLLALLGGRFSRRQIAWTGAGSVGMSALITGLVAVAFLRALPETISYRQTWWTWVDTSGLTAGLSWHLDALSLLMALVITGVGLLIHLYSTGYMIEETHQDYRRFFAYMNLFVASMLTLVLADNLLLLYLGWEGVGLCSYLLIGFWYRRPENGAAAQKAFIVTRLGDTAFAMGLFLLFTEFKTLSIQQVQTLAVEAWPIGSGLAIAVAALLLGGAVGKSAQLPLQVWLPDAMAGPTPVSALIHAATMVTAGVYLIARMHSLFTLAPPVQYAVAVIGVLTLLLAACSALVQRDIKRILAYSTISQLGYMFLALGVGAWSAALFHFMTHACFKALLFLAAGAVIVSLHHEQDIFRMGGLRRRLPVTFWTFLIGAAALSGVPLITSGFYSKDWILWSTLSSPLGGPWLWAGAALGTLLTGLYSFRLIFRVFFGEVRTAPHAAPGTAMTLPLIVLAALSLGVGFLELPTTLGDVPLFSRYLAHALPTIEALPGSQGPSEATEQAAVTLASLLGIGLAALFFLRRPGLTEAMAGSAWGRTVSEVWLHGWGFDRFYNLVIVRPWQRLTRGPGDVVDRLYEALAEALRWSHESFSRTQTGRVRWYAMTAAAGALLLMGLFVLR
ncbi:NADH-quinone oxidoreductase subunit L [Nitrospira moscoviensis]|uniref:NADH-quinone oxidoreductase, membrane subunit L n=1 Tax=Nitrospira moscoviensis TaxID=42253 RepID=A0A0K2GE07_NITMO|nr:NADH-quinone oxidoreductase subunit L [Nitrospira moscoviensis]ALA59195.1 NADH-quinone oxidoreductase, membrane subunit L [Nitrospira moscoviensis]